MGHGQPSAGGLLWAGCRTRIPTRREFPCVPLCVSVIRVPAVGVGVAAVVLWCHADAGARACGDCHCVYVHVCVCVFAGGQGLELLQQSEEVWSLVSVSFDGTVLVWTLAAAGLAPVAAFRRAPVRTLSHTYTNTHSLSRAHTRTP